MVACRKPNTRSAAEGSSPSGSRRQHGGDLLGRGFQAVQGSVAPSTEGGVAGLASKRLDAFSRAMLAIPNECMEGSIGVAEVHATLGWDKQTLQCRCVWEHLADFSLHARDVQALALHLTRQGRPDDR
jgi:hypothetical protein